MQAGAVGWIVTKCCVSLTRMTAEMLVLWCGGQRLGLRAAEDTAWQTADKTLLAHHKSMADSETGAM